MAVVSLSQPIGAYVAPYTASASSPLRAAPSADSPQVGVAYPGGDFDVTETTADGWSAVQINGEKYWLAPGSVAPAQPTKAVTATVTTAVLNVRKGPATTYAVITTVKKGQQLPVLEQSNGWLKVTAGGQTGWISATYAKLVQGATQVPNIHFEKQARVIVDTANVRTGTNTGYDVKWKVNKGTVLPVYATSGGWLEVVYHNDLGWAEGSLMTLEDKGRTNPGVTYSVGENHWGISFPVFGSVTGGKVNLRSGAGTKYKSVAQVSKGTRLEKRGTSGDWTRVVWQGQECYISSAYFKADSNAQPRSISLSMDGLRKQLSLNGVGAVTVSKTDDGLGLLFRLPVRLPQAELDIDTGEFKSLIVDGDTVALTFSQRPSYSLTTSGSNTTVSFTTRLIAVTWKQGDDRDSLTFTAAGSLPADLLSAQPVSLMLGATTDITSLPGPFAGSVTSVDGGVQINLNSQPPASVVRHSAGQITLDLLKPGLRGRTVVIDPGHGGRDPGALGLAGTREKDINLDISLLLRDKLEAAGAKVIMTHATDSAVVSDEQAEAIDYAREVSVSELASRSKMVAANRADMFISIHNNSMGYKSDQSGTETYFCSGTSNAASSKLLANLVQREVVASLGLPSRGVKDEQFYVIKYADAPAVLVEGAFLSNTTDEQMLNDRSVRERMADGMFRAISAYFGANGAAEQ